MKVLETIAVSHSICVFTCLRQYSTLTETRLMNTSGYSLVLADPHPRAHGPHDNPLLKDDQEDAEVRVVLTTTIPPPHVRATSPSATLTVTTTIE